jgi:uncharacterized metal-binding protein YceD (DUF177 family)
MSDFQIQVERLTEQPAGYEFEASREWWADRESVTQEMACEIETPFRFRLTAARVRDDVLIEGEITGRVGLECSRCAKRYPHTLRDSYRLVLSPSKGRQPADPEGDRGLARNGVCLGEDLEAGLYRGPVIQLDDFLGEVIALALPIQPLCDEGCLGICSHCGLDKSGLDKRGLDNKRGLDKRDRETRGLDTEGVGVNHAEPTAEPGPVCDCEDAKIESPFAVLARLRDDLGSRDGE